MATALYFDLDGTLIEYDPFGYPIYESTCADFGVQPTEEAFEFYIQAMIGHFGDGTNPYAAAARDLRDEYDLGIDPEQFADAYTDLEVAASYVPDSVREALEAFAEEYPLGMITNGYGPVQHEKVTGNGIDHLFESVLVATEVGAFKPEREIFETAKDEIDADRRVFVGDNADHDMAAREYGFETVLIENGFGGEQSVDESVADVVIEDKQSIEQVRELL